MACVPGVSPRIARLVAYGPLKCGEVVTTGTVSPHPTNSAAAPRPVAARSVRREMAYSGIRFPSLSPVPMLHASTIRYQVDSAGVVAVVRGRPVRSGALLSRCSSAPILQRRMEEAIWWLRNALSRCPSGNAAPSRVGRTSAVSASRQHSLAQPWFGAEMVPVNWKLNTPWLKSLCPSKLPWPEAPLKRPVPPVTTQ